MPGPSAGISTDGAPVSCHTASAMNAADGPDFASTNRMPASSQALAVVQAAGSAQPARKPPEPQIPSLTYGVAGLDKPAEILVDSWGIPHIYAKSQYDAFFAQGFNAARDRLWQIDLWRRKGLGLL